MTRTVDFSFCSLSSSTSTDEDRSFAELVGSLHDFVTTHGRHVQCLKWAITQLEALIFSADDPERGQARLERVPAATREGLNEAYCLWETDLEKKFTHDFGRGHLRGIEEYRLHGRFVRLLRREIEMLPELPATARLLFIGSGPVPISAILLHRFTGRPVDCVDADPDAVELSSRLLERLELSRAIRVRHAAGQRIEADGYDAVLVALLAKPKRAILHNLADGAGPGCRVICRTSFGLRRLLYEATDPATEIPEEYVVVDRRAVGGASDDTISSLLLRHRKELCA